MFSIINFWQTTSEMASNKKERKFQEETPKSLEEVVNELRESSSHLLYQ